jgi:hypothetical protein
MVAGTALPVISFDAVEDRQSRDLANQQVIAHASLVTIFERRTERQHQLELNVQSP